MTTLRSGYGNRFAETGTIHSMDCQVCGDKMDVESYYGHTSWVGAMSKRKERCDKFICPNINDDWHKQAVEVQYEADQTKVPSLRELAMNDVRKIVKQRRKI